MLADARRDPQKILEKLSEYEKTVLDGIAKAEMEEDAEEDAEKDAKETHPISSGSSGYSFEPKKIWNKGLDKLKL